MVIKQNEQVQLLQRDGVPATSDLPVGAAREGQQGDGGVPEHHVFDTDRYCCRGQSSPPSTPRSSRLLALHAPPPSRLQLRLRYEPTTIISQKLLQPISELGPRSVHMTSSSLNVMIEQNTHTNWLVNTHARERIE